MNNNEELEFLNSLGSEVLTGEDTEDIPDDGFDADAAFEAALADATDGTAPVGNEEIDYEVDTMSNGSMAEENKVDNAELEEDEEDTESLPKLGKFGWGIMILGAIVLLIVGFSLFNKTVLQANQKNVTVVNRGWNASITTDTGDIKTVYTGYGDVLSIGELAEELPSIVTDTVLYDYFVVVKEDGINSENTYKVSTEAAWLDIEVGESLTIVLQDGKVAGIK